MIQAGRAPFGQGPWSTPSHTKVCTAMGFGPAWAKAASSTVRMVRNIVRFINSLPQGRNVYLQRLIRQNNGANLPQREVITNHMSLTSTSQANRMMSQYLAPAYGSVDN